MMGFIVVVYTVGLILGALSMIEWLVSRIARAWLRKSDAKQETKISY